MLFEKKYPRPAYFSEGEKGTFLRSRRRLATLFLLNVLGEGNGWWDEIRTNVSNVSLPTIIFS